MLWVGIESRTCHSQSAESTLIYQLYIREFIFIIYVRFLMLYFSSWLRKSYDDKFIQTIKLRGPISVLGPNISVHKNTW